jgi:hypothetical protein
MANGDAELDERKECGWSKMASQQRRWKRASSSAAAFSQNGGVEAVEEEKSSTGGGHRCGIFMKLRGVHDMTVDAWRPCLAGDAIPRCGKCD